MISNVRGRTDRLRLVLEEQFERHTDELTRLTGHGGAAERNGLDPHTAAALVDSSLQVLADTIEALKRMADGTYGVCERCRHDIPVERLEILPHDRFCVPCQQTRHA